MSDQNVTPTRTPLQRWLGPILLLSVVVNLFFGAHFVVGLFRHFDHGAREGAMMLGLPHGIVMQALTDEERQSLRQLMRPHREALVERFVDIRAARLALSEAVGAEPYNPERAKEAFGQLRNAMNSVATASQGALIDAFEELSPETRAHIAEALKQPRRGQRGNHPGERHNEGGGRTFGQD